MLVFVLQIQTLGRSRDGDAQALLQQVARQVRRQPCMHAHTHTHGTGNLRKKHVQHDMFAPASHARPRLYLVA